MYITHLAILQRSDNPISMHYQAETSKWHLTLKGNAGGSVVCASEAQSLVMCQRERTVLPWLVCHKYNTMESADWHIVSLF